jgi:4-carboxymuconolactone decarboxylase
VSEFTGIINDLRADVLAEESGSRAKLVPHVAELVSSFAYGQVWSRPGLSARDRSIATIAALVAINCPTELKLHVLRGMANGLSKQEISEIVTQLIPYLGFPLTMTAATAVGDLVERVDTDAQQ